MQWNAFHTFDAINDKYLPFEGEGKNMATQIVVAVNKLIFKFYNDGDVYDNRYYMKGWSNDLSSYANWLYNRAGVHELEEISEVYSEEEYTNLLYKVAKKCLNEEFLSNYVNNPIKGSVYDESGPFKFIELDSEDEDDDDY